MPAPGESWNLQSALQLYDLAKSNAATIVRCMLPHGTRVICLETGRRGVVEGYQDDPRKINVMQTCGQGEGLVFGCCVEDVVKE